ncbi:MAG TPA: RNA polymerase sigma-70 factor [Puia sp.]|jgi:RNA polymerase sigma-70 factor (ECF subfamily)
MIDLVEIKELQERLTISDDQVAYVRLYRIYFSPLLRFARSFVGAHPVAEEIVSDAFLHIWEIRKKLSTIRHLTVYLYTCVRNHSLNQLDKQRRESTLLLNEDSLLIPGSLADPEEYLITSQLVRQIDNAVRQLPPRCQAIFRLVREEGLKYREVAEILEISVKTVEAQIGIAMKKLSEAIQPYTGEKKASPSHPFQKK